MKQHKASAGAVWREGLPVGLTDDLEISQSHEQKLTNKTEILYYIDFQWLCFFQRNNVNKTPLSTTAL